MNTIRYAIAFLAAMIVGSWSTQFARADDPPAVKWEYRVLTKADITEQWKVELSMGLNKLGNEGWELVMRDGEYIFKRPVPQNTRQAADLKLTIKFIERDIEMLQERLSWSERMLKLGYVSKAAVTSERERLQRAELTLEKARKNLEGLAPPPRAAVDKGK